MMDYQDSDSIYKIDEKQLRDNLNDALNVLSTVSPSNQKIKKLNQQIIQYMNQPPALKTLISLLIFAQENEAKQNLIISFIQFYLKQQVRPGVAIARHDRAKISQTVNKVFFLQTISNKSKSILMHSYKQFLSTLAPQFIRIRKNLAEQIVNYFLENKGQITSKDISNMLYLIEAVFNDSIESESLRLIEQNLLFRFVNLSLDLFRQMGPQLKKNPVQAAELGSMIQWAQKIHKITTLLFVKAKIDKVMLLKNTVILSPNLANMCLESLQLSTGPNYHFILTSENCLFWEKINEIKTGTLKIINDYLALLNKSRKNLSDLKYTPVIQTIKDIYNFCIPSLKQYLDSHKVRTENENQLLKETLQMFSKSASIPILLDLHTSLRDQLFFIICLNCLITTPEQKILPAQDFCDRKEKIINFEEPKNVQQAASSLIQSFADSVYGSVPHFAKSMINLMDFQLTANPIYFQQIPTLFTESNLFKNFSYFDHIELGLTILSILSYHAQNRDDITVLAEQFLVRRQQFFSRLDVPEEMIVSFLHFCSYYLENFYELILQGRANAKFHRALIFHALELLNATFNYSTKDFINNNSKKIGIQSIDYISNVVIQPHFFSAIFPEWDTDSAGNLINLFSKICLYLDSSASMLILQNVLIDFLKKCIQRHQNDKEKYSQMPTVLRNHLSLLLCEKLTDSFRLNLKNETISKAKILETLSLIIVFCAQPDKIMEKYIPTFMEIIENQFSYVDEVIDIIQIFINRARVEKIQISNILLQCITQCVVKGIKVCDNQKFQKQLFDIIINMGYLKLSQDQIAKALHQNFQQQKENLQVDEQADLAIEKILYLLMQIAFSNFEYVTSETWTIILNSMLQFLRKQYKSSNSITIGKTLCICMCLYIKNPEGVQNYLQSRVQGLWDCIIDNQQQYFSTTEKKIASIVLLNFLGQYSSRPVIKSKFIEILKACTVIIYYTYEKSQISYKDYESEDQENSSSEDSKAESQQWKQKLQKIQENIFLSGLPDQKLMMKNICHKLNQIDHQGFQKFIHSLPIALQNLVRNKIFLYREQISGRNKKMRVILKVKKQSNDQ